MLQIVPHRWYSWDFTISQGTAAIADLGVSCWRERGQVTVDGVAHRIHRERAMSGDFLLESPRGILARATKPSALRREFIVRHGSHTYSLRPRGWFRCVFLLLEDNREIGSIARVNAWSRRASADLPSDLPVPLQAFLVWLTVLMWKREANAASTS